MFCTQNVKGFSRQAGPQVLAWLLALPIQIKTERWQIAASDAKYKRYHDFSGKVKEKPSTKKQTIVHGQAAMQAASCKGFLPTAGRRQAGNCDGRDHGSE
jgi:hypothetical protein